MLLQGSPCIYTTLSKNPSTSLAVWRASHDWYVVVRIVQEPSASQLALVEPRRSPVPKLYRARPMSVYQEDL
jgi:hypothetical protein